MADRDDLGGQLDSLHAISVEIAALHEMSEIHERALSYCRELTGSEFAFTGLLVDGTRVMDVAAISGFEPLDPAFYDQFHLMAVRSELLWRAIREQHPSISNDVLNDPDSVGQPPGHPPVRSFLNVSLQVGTRIIGMIGVANKTGGYREDDERILETLANQVAVAIDNARLYQQQQDMIGSLQQLQQRLSDAERIGLLDRERRRIAGRLHDEIEQRIFSIGLGINSLLETRETDLTTVQRLQSIRQLAVDTADATRQAIFTLAIPGNGEGDLAANLRSLLRDLERTSGLHAHLVVSGKPPPGLGQTQDILYSLINEALTNVQRHANAGMVLVSIRYEVDQVNVVIQDDGVGVPNSIRNTFADSYLHFGLRHMREQALDLGGTFEVANGEEGGTIVRVTLPLPSDAR
jgi:signal transduction histidine kinase